MQPADAGIRRLDLFPDHAETFAIPLDLDDAAVEASLEILSDAEVARVSRMKLPDVRRRNILSLAGLRRTLAECLGVSPDRLVFRRGNHGKPFLEPPHDGLQFNLTNSNDLALVAVSERCELGIDIESLNRTVPSRELARRFFNPQEAACVADSPGTFLWFWTGKEAVMKACGLGLGLPPRCVHIEPGRLGEPQEIIVHHPEITENPVFRLGWNKLGESWLVAMAMPVVPS